MVNKEYSILKTNHEKERWIKARRKDITEDLKTLELKQAAHKWGVPLSTLAGYKKKWNILGPNDAIDYGELPAAIPEPLQVHHKTAGAPEFLQDLFGEAEQYTSYIGLNIAGQKVIALTNETVYMSLLNSIHCIQITRIKITDKVACFPVNTPKDIYLLNITDDHGQAVNTDIVKGEP